MKEFVSLQDIQNIYCISRRIIRNILRNYRVDYYKDNEEVYIKFRDFHKVYTSKYNPTLFILDEKVEDKKPIIENNINRTFFSIFSEPIDRKSKLKKLIMAYAS